MTGVRVHLPCGFVWVDAENAQAIILRHWKLATGGRYFTRTFLSQSLGKRKFLIAYIQNYLFGTPLNGRVWDHIDGDVRNNCRSNLRLATPAENARNTAKRVTNTSGHRGVWYRPDRGYWVARITVDYRNVNLGAFKTYAGAVDARRAAERQYFGEFAPSLCRAAA